ncbi:MAG: CPBP family intramembrane glutamic endopeptidase [Myxococcota bacterium]|nr:CPBP family intramembrane glutamic endopeptidase [Myxococcota bacterium]
MIGRPLPWGMMLLAAFLGWFHSVLSAAIALAIGAVTWNTDKFLVGEWLMVTKADFLVFFPETGETFPLFILHLVAQGLVLALVHGSIVSIGEEAGWRGYLQPALERRFGLFKGTLLVGIIWGYWHFGIRLWDYGDLGAPAVLNGLVIFPAEIIVAAFLYAWLVRRTGSVWPAVCAHGAHNTLPVYSMVAELSWWGVKAASIGATALTAIFVFLLFRYCETPSERYQSILVDHE